MFKKLFGRKNDSDGQFSAFLEGAMEGLRLQTAGHQGALARRSGGNLNQTSGELVFTFPDKIVKAPSQIIGTFDSQANTWMWAWANHSIAEPLMKDSLRVLDYGNQRGIITPKWPSEEMDGCRMAAVANRLCGSNGAYRGPASTTLVFLTFGEIQLVKRG